MATSKSNDDRTREVDLDEVATQIVALERDLQNIPGDSQDIQRLRDEVETLKVTNLVYRY